MEYFIFNLKVCRRCRVGKESIENFVFLKPLVVLGDPLRSTGYCSYRVRLSTLEKLLHSTICHGPIDSRAHREAIKKIKTC